MTLLSPWWLVLLPALYLVIILHTLHPRRHSVLVPSILLWERVLKELAADARWRRLMANLLLLAQLAALASLILALTHPAFRLHSARQRHDVILIDTSASMAATDLAPNRLEAVKERLLTDVKADRPRLLTLIDAGPRPVILYSGSPSTLALRNALSKAKVSDGATDWSRAAVLASSSLASRGGRLIIATDGAVDQEALLPLFEMIPNTPIHIVQAAGKGDNVGITSFDARQTGANIAEYEVLVTVHNFSEAVLQIPLVLRNKQKEIARRLVQLPAGESRNVVFHHTFSTQDVLEAQILFSDALTVDNRAYLTAYPPTPTRVLLVGPGNYFLERGLRVFPQVRLEKRLLYPESSDYPLVIFDRMPIHESFRGTALYLAGTPEDQELGVRTFPEITWWDRSHPLTRFVNWADLGVRQAFQMPRQEGGRVLVESEAGPLVQLLTDDHVRIVTLAFALEESDWPLKVGFPVFLSQLLEWAHPEGWHFVRSPLAPGESIQLPRALSDQDGWRVRLPSGSAVAVPAQEGARFDQTLSAGLYTVMADAGEFYFAVNGGNEQESNLRPRLSLPETSGDASPTNTGIPTAFWWPVAFWAFLLLLAEGWLYIHRVRRPVNLRLPSRQALLRRVRG